MWFFNNTVDIGIDLGTATVLVYVKGQGVVLKEPSVVAVDKIRNKVLAVGEDARNMIGRTPGNIVAVRPLRDGVISDYDITEKMLKHFIVNSVKKVKKVPGKIMVCIPSKATEIERRAVIDATKNSGARKVYLIEEPLAAAIGAGVDISMPNGRMVIDIGGGTCDVAVISLGGVVVRDSIKVAGDTFDEAIIKYIRNNNKLMIGERTAEQLKISVASAISGIRNEKIQVKGRNMVTGLPDEITISTEEIRTAIKEPVKLISDSVKSVLEKTPPELAADIMDDGIVMTGGGSLLFGLNKHLESILGVEVKVAEEAVNCVAEGTGKVLEAIEKLNILMEEEEVRMIE